MDVLIADDDPASAQYLELVLVKLGHSVTVAAGGDEAIALLRQFRFDAVLVDWEMPGADGPVVARWVRQQSENGDTPVIAVSAHEELSSRPEYRESGFNGYVTKPYSTQALASVLHAGAGPIAAANVLVDEAVFRSYAALLSGAGLDVSSAVGRILEGVRHWLGLGGETPEVSKVQSMAGSCAIIGARALSDALLGLAATPLGGELYSSSLRQIRETLDGTEDAMRKLLAG